MRSLLAVLCLLSLISPAAAQQRRALTVPEFLGLDRPAEPAVSPDGRSVTYTVTTTDLNANRRRTDFWLAATTANATPRRLSTDSLGGRGARWSPDGRSIAFISSRGGTPQIWIHDVATGRQRQLTRLSTGADGIQWSPDSRMIAFVSEVYPACPDDACNQRRAGEDERQPSRARLYDGLLYRHWNTWEDALRSHLFVVPVDGATPPRDLLAGKDWDTPVPPFGGSEQYAWSPDARELAFTTKLPQRDQSWTTNLDVYTVAVTGGEPVLQTPGMAGADQQPAYSSDGRYLAFLSLERAGFEADRARLMVKDRQGGAAREVTRGWNYPIGEYAFIPGTNDFWAVAEKRGRHVALHIVFASGDVHEVLGDRNPTQLSYVQTTAGPVLGFVSDAFNQPPQVFVWQVGHGAQRPQQVTSLNADRIAGLSMNPGREIAWTGAGGDSVYGFIVPPPDFHPSRRYPLVVLIHGGPQGAWHDNFHGRWNAQLFASPGYVVALINPRGSTGYGQRFTDEVSRDWGGRVYEDIMRGMDVIARLPYVDSTRMAAAGGSYGGYMVNWINGHDNRFKALVSHAGVYNLEAMYGATEELWFTDWEFGGPYWQNRSDYERWSPHRFAQNFRTPTLVVHGALDYRVPDTEGMQLFTALQRQNVPSRFLHFPDEGHWIGRPQNQLVWWNTVLEWIGRYVGRAAS